MKNKRGISAVIETVLLILIVIAAVGIIAGLVLPMIRTAGERTSTCLGAMDIVSAGSSGVTVVNAKGAVTGVAVNFFKADGTAVAGTLSGTFATGAGKSNSYTVTADTYTKVVVVPTVTTPSAKSVSCSPIEAQI